MSYLECQDCENRTGPCAGREGSPRCKPGHTRYLWKCKNTPQGCCEVYRCKPNHTDRQARSVKLKDTVKYLSSIQNLNLNYNINFSLELIAYIASLKLINNSSG